MFTSLLRLLQHMQELHPGAPYFGDVCVGNVDGKILSQVCQICGQDLAEQDGQDEISPQTEVSNG